MLARGFFKKRILRMLKCGVKMFGRYFSRLDPLFASIQYSGFRFVDFSGSDMRRLNGIKADLRDSKFNQSDLEANLTYANLRDVTQRSQDILNNVFQCISRRGVNGQC